MLKGRAGEAWEAKKVAHFLPLLLKDFLTLTSSFLFAYTSNTLYVSIIKRSGYLISFLNVMLFDVP